MTLYRPKSLVCVFITISCFAYDSLVIDIPPRSQWNFSNGYCGACSIQMAALYHGSYVSQDLVRKSIGDLEILFGSRMNDALTALSFEHASWDGGADMKEYLIWLKENLNKNAPIIVGTMHGDVSNRYHHIILITGYTCDSISTYNDDDTLFYNECHKDYTSRQSLKTWQDNTVHNYFEATRHFGTIVSNIIDPDSETVPVYLSVDHWDEPEPDETPVQFNAEIRIRSLETGKKYILLKYTDHEKVPSGNFSDDSLFFFKEFIATHDTAVFSDSFMSNETAIFRCVPDNSIGIHAESSDKIASNQMIKMLNSNSLSFSVPNGAYVEVSVYNCQGQIVLSPLKAYMSKGNHTVNLDGSSLINGTYYLRISTGVYKNARKLLILK